MFCRLWQFTMKIQRPSLTERLELKRQAARLVRPEKGSGKGESGYCSPSRREGKRWSLYPKYRAPICSVARMDRLLPLIGLSFRNLLKVSVLGMVLGRRMDKGERGFR